VSCVDGPRTVQLMKRNSVHSIQPALLIWRDEKFHGICTRDYDVVISFVLLRGDNYRTINVYRDVSNLLPMLNVWSGVQPTRNDRTFHSHVNKAVRNRLKWKSGNEKLFHLWTNSPHTSRVKPSVRCYPLLSPLVATVL